MSGMISSLPPQFGQVRVTKVKEGVAGSEVSFTWIGVPHWMQNRAPPTFVVPQEEQWIILGSTIPSGNLEMRVNKIIHPGNLDPIEKWYRPLFWWARIGLNNIPLWGLTTFFFGVDENKKPPRGWLFWWARSPTGMLRKDLNNIPLRGLTTFFFSVVENRKPPRGWLLWWARRDLNSRPHQCE